MQTIPLLTITKVLDCDWDPGAVGSLDYAVHCNAMVMWLSGGAGRREPQPVAERQRALAAELRALADHAEAGTGPFTVSVEDAEKRATEIRAQTAEWMRKEMRSVPEAK